MFSEPIDFCLRCERPYTPDTGDERTNFCDFCNKQDILERARVLPEAFLRNVLRHASGDVQ